MKSLSSVVAIIMVLVITIALVGILYTWITTTVGSTAKTGTQVTSKLKEDLTTCMRIDSVSGNRIYLRNCGSGKIYNQSLTVFLDGEQIPHSLPSDIDPGKTGAVKVYGLWKYSLGSHTLKVTLGQLSVQRSVELRLDRKSDAFLNKYVLFEAGELNATAFENGTVLYAGEPITIDEGEIVTFNTSLGKVLRSSGPVFVSGSIYNRPEPGIPVPESWKGKTFAAFLRQSRNTNYTFAFYAFKDAEVVISNQTHSFTLKIPASSFATYSDTFGANTRWVPILIESNESVLAYKWGTHPRMMVDMVPLYPCSRTVYGICSGNCHVIAVHNNTEVRVRNSSVPGTVTYTLNRLETVSIPGGGGQYTGPAFEFSANDTVCVFSTADGDGVEQTVLLPVEAMSSGFYLPRTTISTAIGRFIAMASPFRAEVEITFPNGTSVKDVMKGIGPYVLRYEDIPAGTRIKSSHRIWFIYEDSGLWETVLPGVNVGLY